MLSSFKKVVLIIIGTLALIIGILGLIIRLLPTTPFLLLSSWCYVRSSEKINQKLVNSKLYQKYMSNYIERKGFPLKTKLIILAWVWAIILVIIFTAQSPSIKIIAMILGVFKTLFFVFVINTIR